MNQEFFVFLRKKTYTSFLFLREKTKSKNNYIDFRFGSSKNINYNKGLNQKEKINNGKFNFIINSYCTKVIENNEDEKNQNNNEIKENKITNICNESVIDGLSLLYNEQDNFIQFECNKCSKKQTVIITCFYEKNNDLKYHINFWLVTPSAILRQKWFKDSNEINISNIRKDYMECYLSTLFYFHQQGLIYDFLLPQTIEEKELFIEKISQNVSDDKGNLYEDASENDNSDIILVENNEEIKDKKEDEEDPKGHIHVSSTLDLGDQNVGFFEPIDAGVINKTSTVKKMGAIKKKELNTITCGEFKLNIEEKK